MNSRERFLSLLGLSLRGRRLVIGEEPVEAAVRAKDARVLLLSCDAAENTRRRTARFADTGQCIWLQVPFTKAELGRSLGRGSVAIAAVTDVGLAAAAIHRLEELDAERYGAAAARLDVKAQRAAERKAEQLAHEKNLRRGVRSEKKAPPPAGGKGVPSPGRSGVPPTRQDAPKRSGTAGRKSRPSRENRPQPRAKANPYARSRPVKKGKGSFRRKEN